MKQKINYWKIATILLFAIIIGISYVTLTNKIVSNSIEYGVIKGQESLIGYMLMKGCDVIVLPIGNESLGFINVQCFKGGEEQ